MEQLEVNKKQEEIYNAYLKALAISQNRPYSYRKDFSKMKDSDKISLFKLEQFFNRNDEINIALYFKAGFLQSQDTFFNLEHFNNIGILKCYSKLLKERYNTFIDSNESVIDFIEGLKFIISFLKDNKSTVSAYNNLLNDSGIPWFLIHLKQQKISLFHLHCFKVSLSQLVEDEILNLYLDNFKTKFFETRKQYLSSKKLRLIGDTITKQTNKE